MSYQASGWAIEQRTGDPTLKCLLMALASYADEFGECWPSLDRLALDTEVSKRTIQRALDRLSELGFITIEARERRDGGRTSNRYRLAMRQNDHGGVDKTPGAVVTGDVGAMATKESTPNEPSGKNRQLEPVVCTRESAERIFEEQFWPTYPNRDGGNPKKPAKQKFVLAVMKGENPERIVDGVKRLRSWCDAKGTTGTDKVPHAATWINQERWNDQPAAPPDGGGRKLDFFDIAAGRR